MYSCHPNDAEENLTKRGVWQTFSFHWNEAEDSRTLPPGRVYIHALTPSFALILH